MTLTRNFHNNVPVHRIRAAKTSDYIAQEWDTNLYQLISDIADKTLSPQHKYSSTSHS